MNEMRFLAQGTEGEVVEFFPRDGNWVLRYVDHNEVVCEKATDDDLGAEVLLRRFQDIQLWIWWGIFSDVQRMNYMSTGLL